MSRIATAKEVGFFLRQLRASARLHHGTVDDVRRVRHESLGRILEAAARTPLYKKAVTKAAIRERRLDAIEPVTKSEFQSRLSETFSDRRAAQRLSVERLTEWVRDPSRAGTFLDDKYLVAMTSGTTGRVGLFVNDIESWGRMRGLTFARMFRGRMSAGDFYRLLEIRQYKMTFIVGNASHTMTSLLAKKVPRAGKMVLLASTLSVEMPIPAIVSELNRIQPHLLHSYATVLELIAAEKKAGRLTAEPDVITSGSEPLSARGREAIAEAFPRAQLIETYAATECVPLATADEEGELLINEDGCVLEAVDDNLRPVAPGEMASKVLVTNLFNRLQPLVRYVLTDQVEIEPHQARDGSPFSRIRVHGRTDDTFFLQGDDGRWQAHPPIPFEVLMLTVRGLLQYQLVHERQNFIRINFVPEPGPPSDNLRARLAAAMRRYLDEHGAGESVDFLLDEQAALIRPEKGKIRQIRSDVPRPDDATATGAQVIRERRRGRMKNYDGPERRRR